MQPIKYYCEEYPVVNYTVKLTDVSSSELWSLSVLAKDSITADGLLEDTVYVFELIAVNDFGAVSTDNHTICMLTSTLSYCN
jgi:AAA+ superfamily predicted ATPase